MRIILFVVLFSLFFLMSSTISKGEDGTVSSQLKEVIENYMNAFDSIPNECNAKPLYEVYFVNNNDSVGLWISAYLGLPSPLVPVKPGAEVDPNPMEIKGVLSFNNRLVVFYDRKESDGYGLYEPSKLNAYRDESFDNLPQRCTNVWYPEGWYFNIVGDSLIMMKKSRPFQLK